MSSKIRARRNRTANASATGAARAVYSVPEPATEPATVAAARTVAEDKLWAALHVNPHATTGELSSAAGIGKSTAAKILARWATDGSVTRTSGIAEGGRRAADRWSITDTDTPTDVEPEAAASADTPDVPFTAEVVESAETTIDNESAVDSASTEPTGGDNANVDAGAAAKPPRLAPGALRGLVEDYLRDHSSEEFSPNMIGTALGRSSGAVNNALEKLVENGYAVKTKEAPKRFALAPTERTSAPDTAAE
jgi:predicted transcriptional regulator